MSNDVTSTKVNGPMDPARLAPEGWEVEDWIATNVSEGLDELLIEHDGELGEAWDNIGMESRRVLGARVANIVREQLGPVLADRDRLEELAAKLEAHLVGATARAKRLRDERNRAVEACSEAEKAAAEAVAVSERWEARHGEAVMYTAEQGITLDGARAEATRLGELLDNIVEQACEALGDAGGDLVELARAKVAEAEELRLYVLNNAATCDELDRELAAARAEKGGS